MIDPLKYSYYLVLVTEKKKKYDITNFVEHLGREAPYLYFHINLVKLELLFC